MVFDSSRFIFIVFGGIVIWLGVATLFLFQMTRHYNRITSGVDKKTLKEILEKILARQQKTEQMLKEVIEKSNRLEDTGQRHIQKVGLMRFNPFAETGGEVIYGTNVLRKMSREKR